MIEQQRNMRYFTGNPPYSIPSYSSLAEAVLRCSSSRSWAGLIVMCR